MLWYKSILSLGADNEKSVYLPLMIHSTYPENTIGQTDWKFASGRPVKTAGCVLMLCVGGMASVTVDMRRYSFRRGDLLVLTSDIFMQVQRVSRNFSARYISLSDSMMELAYIKLTDMSLWVCLHFCPVLQLSAEQSGMVSDWMTQQSWIFSNMAQDVAAQMVGSNVYNMFLAIDSKLNDSGIKHSMGHPSGMRAIVNRFWLLVAKHFPRYRDVKFYADALNITPEYFYKVCRRIYGASPKQLIDQQLAVEIKTCLADTDLSVKEIAERLCFDDDSYMCRFFRRMTGMSLLQFRNGTQT